MRQYKSYDFFVLPNKFICLKKKSQQKKYKEIILVQNLWTKNTIFLKDILLKFPGKNGAGKTTMILKFLGCYVNGHPVMEICMLMITIKYFCNQHLIENQLHLYNNMHAL